MADSDRADSGRKKAIKSYRSMPKYDVNPSQGASAESMWSKQNEGGERMYLVKVDDLSGMPVGLHTVKRVDKVEFAKLYVDRVKEFCALSQCGASLFEIIYKHILDHKDSDQICLHFNVVREEWPISDRTYQRAIGELLDKKFLYQSKVPHHYWINTGYIFKCDSFSVIQTYAREDSAWDEPILPGI